MHSDHCAKEKKDVYLLEKEKLLATYQSLGEDQILKRPNKELLSYFLEAENQMIDQAGGRNMWDKLSENEKTERRVTFMKQLAKDLGKDPLQSLSVP